MIRWGLATLLIALAFEVAAFAALPDHIVVYYSFSEGSGTKVKDLSKYGNDGEIEGEAKWTVGEHDGALELNGATGMISAPISDSLCSLKEPMSVGAILKIVEFPVEWQSLACMYPNEKCSNNDRENGWKCGFHNRNPTLTRWLAGDYHATDVTLETDKWYYLVYVLNPDDAKFYVDGELAQHMAAPAVAGIDVHSPLHIGVEEGIGNWYSHIILDEFWISSVEVSPDEIKMLASPESVISVNPGDKLATTWGEVKSLYR